MKAIFTVIIAAFWLIERGLALFSEGRLLSLTEG